MKKHNLNSHYEPKTLFLKKETKKKKKEKKKHQKNYVCNLMQKIIKICSINLFKKLILGHLLSKNLSARFFLRK